jgi:Ca-activated chloride channel family protein
MRIDANDPRWTSYALGEVTDEREKAELESILEKSEEMRSVVEEIRKTADLLTEELQAEPQLQLSHSQKQKIEAKVNARRSRLRLRPVWALASVAAALVLAISVLVVQSNRHETASAKRNANSVLTASVAKPDLQRTGLEVPAGTNPRLKSNPKPNADVSSLPPPVETTASPAISEKREQQASLQGTVKDAAGCVIPGAVVKVLENSTGEVKQATTDQVGRFHLPALSPGPYTISAEAPGFKQMTIVDLPLTAASTKKLDLTLDVGTIAEAVAVTAAAPALTTESSTVAHAQTPPLARLGFVSVGAVHMPPMRPDLMPIQRQRMPFNTEAYDYIGENPFLDAGQNPLSTFSIDVDTASHSNVRRFIESEAFPPKDAVRIEELVNYFDYDYKGPKDDKPFAASFELTEAPWKPEHKLLRIGLKGREIKQGNRPAGNLVFLLDVSGSMADDNKLPLVKESMRLLVDQLNESDRVAIVVYANNTSLLLPSTSGDQKQKLLQAIDGLHAGGSTNGAAGIQLAYQTAQQNFIQGGINRVILATDGDFNVGITNRGDLTRLIEEKAKSGIFLSALGFGMGNYKDATLELLATKGRGNYAYIDTLNEARKVLVEQINSTLVTIAKDVKIQVEFNPRRVGQYRLIGYEDRTMPKEDFNDDDKTAGAIGAGHAVTALYEIVPAGSSNSAPKVDPLKYQKPVRPSSAADSDELLTLKIRSKEPEKDKSVLSEFTVRDSPRKFKEASQDFKFAAAVAAFGMVLRDSPHKGNATLDQALEWANEGKGADTHGYRQEFIRLMHRALSLNP